MFSLNKKTAESECLRLFYLLNDCHLYKADDTLLRLGGLCMLGLLYHVLTANAGQDLASALTLQLLMVPVPVFLPVMPPK